jgi:hypothetical protein
MDFGPRAVLLGQDVDAPGVAAEDIGSNDMHALVPTAEVVRRLLVLEPRVDHEVLATPRLERHLAARTGLAGTDTDEEKEEKFAAFQRGEARVLVIKPVIGAWGLNWQHCAHMTVFAGYSFEQYYQGVRRCWRFGQKRPVVVDHVISDGEIEVLASRKRKAQQSDQMFSELVAHMRDAVEIARSTYGNKTQEVPSWL